MVLRQSGIAVRTRRLIGETLRSDSCRISTLDLNNNQIGAHVVTQAVKFNKSLTSLDIRNVEAANKDDILASIGSYLLQDDCMCRLGFLSCDAFQVVAGQEALVLKKPIVLLHGE